VIGLVILVLGLLWPIIARLGLGRLPGDIVIQRGNFSFYFPLMTSILVRVLLSVALWMYRPRIYAVANVTKESCVMDRQSIPASPLLSFSTQAGTPSRRRSKTILNSWRRVNPEAPEAKQALGNPLFGEISGSGSRWC
jgi:hypothetical protein